MRTDIHQLRRAQSNLVLGGLLEALALEMGVEGPRLRTVAVVFQGEGADGEDVLGAFAFNDEGDWLCEAHTAHLLTAGTHGVLERHLFGDEAEEAERPHGEE